jgi:outer membrane protein TolC
MRILFLTLFAILSGLKTYAAENISLENYLKSVASENLQLKAVQASSEAADARSTGVQIPEPMVGYMQMTDASGSSNGIEISQTIPFPSKLTRNRSARKLEAAAEKANSESVKSEIFAKARLIYFNVWAAQSRVQFLKDKRSAIQEHLRLSNASTRSDSSLRIHTLKAESDYDLTENDIVEAEQALKEKQIIMASFVNKDPDQYEPQVQEPPMAMVPEQKLIDLSPRVEFKRLSLEMLGEKESAAKSSWFPDLNLRYRELGDTPMTSGYREVMVGVTLPFVFFWEPNAESKSATADKVKAEAEFHQERLEVKAKSVSLKARAESLKKQLNLIQSKLIPRAEKRMKLVHNLAPRDMESLQEHREGMETFPDLKLKSLDLRIQYEETISELAALAAGGL